MLTRFALPLIVFISLLFIAIAAPGPGLHAQTVDGEAAATQMPEPLSSEAIREMVARMSDDQVRVMLLERLDAVATESTEETVEFQSLAVTLTRTWEAFYTPVVEAVQRIPILFARQIEAFATFAGSFGASGLAVLFGLLVGILALGYAAELLVTKTLERRTKKTLAQDTGSLRDTLVFLAKRFGREILGLAVFYIVIRIIGASFLSPQQIAILAPAVRLLILIPRLIAALSRFALAPYEPQYRLVSVNDHWAKYLHRNLIGLGLLGGFTMFIIGFNAQFGVPIGETRLGFWLTLALHIYIIVIAWTAREGLVEMMLGNDPDRTRYDVQVAQFYPMFAIFVSAFIWVVSTIVAGFGNIALLLKAPHYTTMFWLLMAPIIDTIIRGLVRHLQPPMIGEGPVAEQAYKSNKRSLIRIGRVLAFGMIVLIIASAWEIDLSNVGANSAGEQFIGNLVEFLVICAIGYIVFELMSLWINRRLAREQSSSMTSDQEAGEGGGAGGSRLATVLPLVLMTAQIAIGVIFGLLAIGTLGIDITPLLAGAGILGLAIGFGAQKLVTDIVSGVFFLIDDAFRVGEYVDVGGTMGAVEKISIRSMQLRHHRGNVHTIPYGSVEKVTNFSRDWVIMKLMFTVPFDTDPNKVKKIFKKIGAEMLEDPLFKNDFLEPFKSQGVFQFDDVGIVMRGKFMAKPGTQFTIRKEIYNRVRKEFEANGIEFARREVRVALPGVDDQDGMTEEQRTTIEAAASGAVQAQVEQEAAEAAAAKK
ncbi:mechanosensitive ion channel family protein [Roseobacter denitrificans]|uniref:Mechanosensitive ion channel protein, putative n=1 Tax=Roseobacter denitrificans (strain ATCC 33942 / OCh 114) TaxID=375451 RepID=Q161Z0_ROSDO|nr:mechanosensitive ion channel family protein [Roseobacter denitrificans]ABG33203.1 mechanosensitive ion channel protein, putative [Roseobacter denitrificans OCh 114]AVL52552.1 mechanosensitive ion channel family protein [Roseobacter denitrificans]SFG29849.1 Small-conductance mechanosensitive channel [Roseobacter denitrificans OCh 114]